MWFSQVPDPKRAENRGHVDLADPDAVGKLAELGATVVGEHQVPGAAIQVNRDTGSMNASSPWATSARQVGLHRCLKIPSATPLPIPAAALCPAAGQPRMSAFVVSLHRPSGQRSPAE